MPGQAETGPAAAASAATKREACIGWGERGTEKEKRLKEREKEEIKEDKRENVEWNANKKVKKLGLMMIDRMSTSLKMSVCLEK